MEKAETINSSSLRDEFFSYQVAICSKQQAIKSQIQKLTGTSLASAQNKYSEIKNAWRDCVDLFDTWHSNNSETTSKSLTEYFKKKLATVDRVSRDIIPNTAEKILEKELHLTPEASRKSITSARESLGAPLANEMLSCLAEHTELTNILNDIVDKIADKAVDHSESSSHIVAAAEEEESASDSVWNNIPDSPELMALDEAANSQSEEHPHVKKFLDVLLVLPALLEAKVAELSPILQPFTTSSDDLPPESTFYVNQDGAICIRALEDQQGPLPSLEQQQAAAKLFFSALEDFFGTELIGNIVPAEQQQQPLTIQKTHEVFDKLRETLQHINAFLETNSLLITPEYIVELATHPEAAVAAREAHQQLGAEGNIWLHAIQEVGLCGMLLSGSKIGLALASVCTPTLPCVALALGAATIDGYIMGRFIARESGVSQNTQQEAGALGATSTVGSAAGLILQRVAQGAIGAYVPEIISSSVAEYGGSYVAMSLRNAALGGARTAESQHGSDDQQHPMSAEDVISLEPRLARLFGIELPSLSHLIAVAANIPTALGGTSSSTVVPFATSPSSTTVHES